MINMFFLSADIRSHEEYVLFDAARRAEERDRRALEPPAVANAEAAVVPVEARRGAYLHWVAHRT